MTSHNCKTLQSTVVVLAATLLMGLASRANAQDYRESSSRTLEGTWWVQVTTLTDCVSRTPLLSFSSLLTFAAAAER